MIGGMRPVPRSRGWPTSGEFRPARPEELAMIGLGPSVPMPRFREPLNVAAFILACAEPNTVYCATGDGTLRALDLATNAVKWEIPGLLRGYSTLRSACKGNHLVVTPGYSSPDREGSVYCLDRHTGRLRWEPRWVPRETSGAERKVHLAVTSEVCVVGLQGVNGLTGWDLATGAARFSVPEPNLPGDLRDSRLQALQDSHDLFFVWKQLWVPTSRIHTTVPILPKVQHVSPVVTNGVMLLGPRPARDYHGTQRTPDRCIEACRLSGHAKRPFLLF